MERKIGSAPEPKSGEYRIHQFLQLGKVSIMGAETPGQLPNPFDRIEIGTVGRKEVELQSKTMLGEPSVKNHRAMMAGVIDNHDHLSTRSGMANEGPQENLECLGVEHLGRPGDKTPVGGADRSEHRHRLVGGCMVQDRISRFRGNPHDAARPMLLKMAFIAKPQINVVSSGQSSEFFYMRPGPPDRLGQSETGVFSVGIPTDGRAAGIDGRPCRSDSGFSGDGSEVSRPRGPGDSPRVVARIGDPDRRVAGCFRSKRVAFRFSLLPAARRNHDPGTDGSSTGLSEGSALKGPQRHRSSYPSKPGARRAADGRSGIPRIAGSRFGWPVS